MVKKKDKLIDVSHIMDKHEIGDPISDCELKQLIGVMYTALNALEHLNRRRYDLVTNDIRDIHKRLFDQVQCRGFSRSGSMKALNVFGMKKRVKGL